MANSDFEFEQWCREYECEEDTVNALKEKGFKSYKSISRITNDILKN